MVLLISLDSKAPRLAVWNENLDRGGWPGFALEARSVT
jgi:hypothetical protein